MADRYPEVEPHDHRMPAAPRAAGRPDAELVVDDDAGHGASGTTNGTPLAALDRFAQKE